MAENTKIQWAHHTLNPWRGCTKISEGCLHCYAETQSARNPTVLGEWGPSGTRVIAAEAQWSNPPKWDRWAANGTCYHCHGKSTRPTEGRCEVCDGKGNIGPYRARVFCASFADVFEGPETMPSDSTTESALARPDHVPSLNNYEIAGARNRLFRLIDLTPNLDWLLLTKRPQNVVPLYGNWLHWTRSIDRRPVEFPPNVWIGCSVENQKRAEERMPHLCRIPARVRFVSCEPLLESVDLRPWLDRDRGANWVICGGESGGGAREFNTDWGRLLRDQCGDAGVPYFFKQTGSNVIQLTVKGKGGDLDDIPLDLRVREFPR